MYISLFLFVDILLLISRMLSTIEISVIIIITPNVGRTYKNQALRPKWIAALYFIDSSNRVFIHVHRQELTVYIGSSEL